MKIPTYILGFLKRYGPLHGYKLKQLLSDMVSDFTQIKLPTIYYHLEKMEAKGIIAAAREQAGNRPERSVYTITRQGEDAFIDMLTSSLAAHYRPEFTIDTCFYFSDALPGNKIVESLKRHEAYCVKVLQHLKEHRKEIMQLIPQEAQFAAETIFRHHLAHYKTELQWLRDTLKELSGK
jgi:DNA-binding PadR family transcriptional regulator